MPEKTRYPAHELSHADYLGWIKRVVKWLGNRVGEEDYPAELADELAVKVEEFERALLEYDGLRSVVGGKHEKYVRAFGALRKQMIMAKKLLPIFAPNPPVLGDFGLAGKIEHDKDELSTRAAVVAGYWEDICDPDPPPEFSSVASDMDKLVELFDGFIVARNEYEQTYIAAEGAQNDMIEARAACHKVERKIFRWYRAHHPKTRGEWWTATEWGTSRGRRKKVESLEGRGES